MAMGEGEGRTGLLGKIVVFLEMIKFSHTVFALPFALTGAVLAAEGLPDGRTLFWIMVAMVGARTGAMGVNRLADRHYDALNPRTQGRALPRGIIRPWTVWGFVLAAFALLVFAAGQLNRLCLFLSPVAIVAVVGYSYTKRFTTWSHGILGLSLSLAPIGAWIAVAGEISSPALLLGGAVILWVSGFDILYSLADIDFDRGQQLYSLPAQLGERPARAISLALHLLVLPCLILLGTQVGLGPLYYVGVAVVAGLLAFEHVTVHRHGLARLDLAFFNVNGLVSVSLFSFTLLDLLFG